MNFSATKTGIMRKYFLLNCLFCIIYGRPDIIEEEVLDEILYNYNKLARPATAQEPMITVKHGVNLIKIEECDGKTLKALTWLPISWTDPRLEWSLSFYNIQSITLPSDLLWTPDIVLYNSPSSHAGNAYNPRVFIYNSGSLSWYPPTHITTNCEESEVEHDIVFCYMRFGSWSYHGEQLDLEPSSETVDTEDYVEHSEWEYVNSSVTRNVKKYACCPEPYPDITYNITLRRREIHMESTITAAESTNGKIRRDKPMQDQGFEDEKNSTATYDFSNDKPLLKSNNLHANGSDPTEKSGK